MHGQFEFQCDSFNQVVQNLLDRLMRASNTYSAIPISIVTVVH